MSSLGRSDIWASHAIGNTTNRNARASAALARILAGLRRAARRPVAMRRGSSFMGGRPRATTADERAQYEHRRGEHDGDRARIAPVRIVERLRERVIIRDLR